jgi:hypothetical protein
MNDQDTPTRANGAAAAAAAANGDSGWQKELVDAVVAAVDEKLTNGDQNSSSSLQPAAVSDVAPTNGEVEQVTAISPTPEGREAYLAEIDGPRPMSDGTTLDNAVATFRANDVYVAAGASRDVEVPVWMANSTITIVKVGVDDEHSEGFDVGYGVSIAAPDGGGVKVVEADRRITMIGSEAKPALTFQVEKVPTTVRLKFDNAYSWINSKKVQYHVEVKPPIDEEIIARARRAEVAIDALAVELHKAKEGVSQIQAVRQAVEKKAAEAKKMVNDHRKELEAKVEDFKNSVKMVKQAEQSLKEKELETGKNEKIIAQMVGDRDQIQARIEELRKELQSAKSKLESKTEQIQAQEELVVANKQDVLAMEDDIDNRLNGIEESGGNVKKLEEFLKEIEKVSVEASKEHAVVAEEEGKSTEHLKFYEKLFSDLKLRLMEVPREV